MAEHNTPALDTQIESGGFDEKRELNQPTNTNKPKAENDEDEDEDIDALIEDLESQDGHGLDDDEEEERDQTGGRVIPEELLQTVSKRLCYNLSSFWSIAMLTTQTHRTPELVSLRLRSPRDARSSVSTR